MANPNAPFGFKPIRSATGGASLSVSQYKYSSTSARIGKGDLLILDGSGQVKKETSAVSVGPWVGVALCGSGVISAAAEIPVCDDQNAIFEVQGPTAALALTDLNRIVKVDGSPAADTNTNLSQMKLTNTAATASNGVRLVRLANIPGNTFAAYQKLEVAFNSRLAGSAGV